MLTPNTALSPFAQHPGTERMVDAALLATMRRGVYIVNCARGKLVDTQALVDALASGQVAGYGGDGALSRRRGLAAPNLSDVPLAS